MRRIAGAELETLCLHLGPCSAWECARAGSRGVNRPQGKGNPDPVAKRVRPRGDKAESRKKFSSKPARAEKPIDPETPFAAALWN